MEQIKKNDINYFYLENKESACIQYDNFKTKIDIDFKKNVQIYYPNIIDIFRKNSNNELLTKKCKLLLKKIEETKYYSTILFNAKAEGSKYSSAYIKKYHRNLLFSYRKYDNIARHKKNAIKSELFFLRFIELNLITLQSFLNKKGSLDYSCPTFAYDLSQEIDCYYYTINNLHERLTNLFNVLLSNENKDLSLESKETIEFLITFKYKFFFLFLNYYSSNRKIGMCDYKITVTDNINGALSTLDMYFPPQENFKCNSLINFFFILNNTTFEDRTCRTNFIKEFNEFIKHSFFFYEEMRLSELRESFSSYLPAYSLNYEKEPTLKQLHKIWMVDNYVDFIELNKLASINYYRHFEWRTDFSNVLSIFEQQAMFNNTNIPMYSINNKIEYETYKLCPYYAEVFPLGSTYTYNGIFNDYIITKEVNNMNTCCFTEDMLTFEYIEQVVNVCLEMSHSGFFGQIFERMTRYKERGRPPMY